MEYKAKDRMALVSKKNMKKMVKYFDVEDYKNLDLTWAVNYLVEIAIGELKAIGDKLVEEERELQKFINE